MDPIVLLFCQAMKYVPIRLFIVCVSYSTSLLRLICIKEAHQLPFLFVSFTFSFLPFFSSLFLPSSARVYHIHVFLIKVWTEKCPSFPIAFLTLFLSCYCATSTILTILLFFLYIKLKKRLLAMFSMRETLKQGQTKGSLVKSYKILFSLFHVSPLTGYAVITTQDSLWHHLCLSFSTAYLLNISW